MRIPTAGGPAWFKASGPGTAHEGPLLSRALAWERALLDLAPDEMDGHGDAIAGWLVELGERLDGPVWHR